MDKVHGYAYQKNVFTKEECEKIINIAKNKSWSRGKIRSVKKSIDYELKDMRSSNICWINCDEETDWIFSKIIYSAFKLNADFFQFNISGMDEGLQFTNYKSPSDRYDKHIDRCYNAKVRKLSLSIQLTDPNNYEGGELVIETINTEEKFKLNVGEIILYPSSYLHAVNKVNNGERLVCVGWIESYVKSTEKREYLFDLDAGARSLLAKHGRSDELDLIFKSYSNLLRVFGD